MTDARTDFPMIGKIRGRFSKHWKKYPKCRDSGVEWLGEVPEGWRTRRIKYMLPARRVPAQDETYKLALENVASWTGTITGASPDLEGDGLAFDQGDVLFGKLRPYLAKACVADRRGAAVGDFFVMRPASDVLPAYCVSLLLTQEFISIVDGSTYGAKMPRADWDFFSDQRLPVPSTPEQRAIAHFLDRETGRIDALIAKKERQIELLQEKRQALITHAVTKGLDPNAKMKDSGVEWLGEIPEGWQVKKLRYLFHNLDYRRIPLSAEERSYMEKSYPYYGASGVIDQVDRYLFDEPLILVAEDGANLLSRSTPLAFIARGQYWVNNHAHILKPKQGNIIYWEALLQTFDYTPLITGAAQPKLTADNLGGITLPSPPTDEQDVIAKYLNQQAGYIDVLTAKIESSIALLREYRTALISAAVTGKIDVREEVA